MTRKLNSPTLLREISERFRALAQAPETPESRAEVEAALASKWWSVRAVAIRVIGRWGGKANKAWLIERALRAEGRMAGGVYRHAVRQSWRDLEAQTAAEALRPHLGEEDAEWLLDRWFSDEPVADALRGHIMTQMALEPIERRVAEELARRPSAQRRLPLLWIVRLRTGLSDRVEILTRLARGRDDAAELARLMIRWEAQDAERRSESAAIPKKAAARRAAREAEKSSDAEARRKAGRKGRR